MTTASGPTAPHGSLLPGLWLDRFDFAAGMLIKAQWDGGMPYQRAGEVSGAVEDPLSLLPEDAVPTDKMIPATVNGRCWNRLCGRAVLAATSMARFEASKLNTGLACGVQP